MTFHFVSIGEILSDTVAYEAEIDMRFAPLVEMADATLKYKYVIKNTAKKIGHYIILALLGAMFIFIIISIFLILKSSGVIW